MRYFRTILLCIVLCFQATAQNSVSIPGGVSSGGSGGTRTFAVALVCQAGAAGAGISTPSPGAPPLVCPNGDDPAISIPSGTYTYYFWTPDWVVDRAVTSISIVGKLRSADNNTGHAANVRISLACVAANAATNGPTFTAQTPIAVSMSASANAQVAFAATYSYSCTGTATATAGLRVKVETDVGTVTSPVQYTALGGTY